MVTEEYSLENLTCVDCANDIEKKVGKLSEVESVHLDFLNKTMTITSKNNKELQHNIIRIVKNVEPDLRIKLVSESEERGETAFPWPLAIAALGVLVFIFGYSFKLPQAYKIGLYILAYLLSSWKVLYNAVLKAVNGRLLDEHFLMSIASLGAIYLGQYAEAIAVMVLYEIGQFFENKAVNHSRNSVRNLIKLKPDLVHRMINGQINDILITDVQINEYIIVLPGERIPLDGVVISGQSSLDMSALTGEALPIAVEKGHKVTSGSMNLSGKITLQVTSADADSTVTRILKLVEDATQKKSRTERFITRFARKYTPAVVLLAIIIALVPPSITSNPFHVWFKRALIFLVVSCPCALIISVPLTNFAAIGAAARKGILFKGSNFIDALARATTFVYDKTGTLTTGKLAIRDVVPLPKVDEKRLIIAALTCEESSNHPIATAVKKRFEGQYAVPESLITQEFHGRGIKVQTVDNVFYAGNREFLQHWNVQNLPSEPVETCIFLAEKDQCLGYVTFMDEMKSDFPIVIRKLRKMGVRKHFMLTGDHSYQAQKVALELKMDNYYSQLLPEDKTKELERIEQSQAEPVAFIGDGLNDAPVISRAEIGIAMGAIGNQASIEAADVVLMKDEPEQLLTAYRLTRKTRSLLWQNIVLALGIKIGVMVLGTLGLANLWEAVIADVGVTLLAIANSTRLLRF